VIESHEDTLLAMLLRHYDKDKEESLFVQRDPKMFRWILYWYTTGILVEADTVKVPKEVWDEEVRYYALFSPVVEESKKRIRDESHELAQKAIEQFGKMEKAYQKRRKYYGHLLTYMMDKQQLDNNGWSHYTFISADTLSYPDAYDKRVRINASWLEHNFKEFSNYCADVGFKVKKGYYSPGRVDESYVHPPASCMYVTTRHACLYVSFKRKDD
jgi:hypothetical protein